ncbi:Glycosyltransferase involved in cell wall bisynthesis [Candidatus Kryptonium thompsonii]|jgi:glycosyltransferase involved in cell wall biosynthesis|uniref:Glycosyltransferase involved in cell wall bisynthesis n=1 Tax=Candidatus Kryptonium thompsonii TaxID=1633631 RepID=A0A0P1MAC9_9BACT|nr:glycosyltransferase family 4 protein [Candidatus Kryptonium thompsoni]CUS77491.1 Glycosyltransferase involved in cell wall bisynthesis [Candidatus Kryptonium thompsoni]CUS80083.1 Glycosyltransferase involved in cell wall bisynthesis [Candidatus Kryptonium thompsoni]CUS81194.1 Glycosyltransferase involved in cell wall bisynthesis [Candidatus Kryptonium thompsoni]CUS81483.1 Glycosyltransferase involved in cell wall bisynthesis [Candidatus Kryptonium thompsoni]CUS82123.1 Glycosyltransferase in
MKILYVVTSAGFGGASMHVLQLMRYMRGLGHSVGLVSAPEPRLVREAREMGVEIFQNPYFVRRLHLVNDLRAFIPVYKAIKKFKPDIIHAHSSKAGIIARFWSAVLNVKPVVFTAHGWVFTEGKKFWKRWLLAQVERVASIVTTKIICVSEHDRELAIEFKVAPPEKLLVIHNGVDPSLFQNIVKSQPHNDKPIVTFVGRLAPPKDLFFLIDVAENIDNAVFWIVGDGELREKVQRYVSKKGLTDRIVLWGERYDIPEIFSKTDIFVLPSRWEGLPLTIIEAMMAGLPVVASNVGGVPELVEDGVNGFLVPPGDIVKFTKALQTLIENETLRKEMGEAGRAKAMKNFSLDKMLSKTVEVYYELLKSKEPVENVKDC